MFYQSIQDEGRIQCQIENLQTLIRSSSNERPIVLWNVRPVNAVNIIHLMYLIKLKTLLKLGFDCQICIFDDTEKRKKTHSSKPINQYAQKTKAYFETFLEKKCCVFESQISKEVQTREN